MRTGRKKIWNDNAGFTLVELLVVIAITAILTGVVTISYSVVNNSNVNKAARNFASVLSRARAESMAKGTEAGQLVLSCADNRLYYQLGNDPDAVKEEICNLSLVGVSTVMRDGSGGDIVDGWTMTICFKTSGMVDTLNGADVSQLVFTRGNRRVATMLYLSGKNDTMML